MAISVKDNRLVVECGDYTDYSSAEVYIRALLNTLQSITENDRLIPDDIYYICELIHALLPSNSQFCEMTK